MLKTMMDSLKKIFPGANPHYHMEQFLLSKNIKTASDIEHWQRQYEMYRHKGWL